MKRKTQKKHNYLPMEIKEALLRGLQVKHAVLLAAQVLQPKSRGMQRIS